MRGIVRLTDRQPDHSSRDDNVLIIPAAMALTVVADVLSPGRSGVLMCTVSTERMTLEDQPFIWPPSLRGTPKTGSERACLWLMTEMTQLPRRRPRCGLKPSRILPEPKANNIIFIKACRGYQLCCRYKFLGLSEMHRASFWTWWIFDN